jgi:hypothetical protein
LDATLVGLKAVQKAYCLVVLLAWKMVYPMAGLLDRLWVGRWVGVKVDTSAGMKVDERVDEMAEHLAGLLVETWDAY